MDLIGVKLRLAKWIVIAWVLFCLDHLTFNGQRFFPTKFKIDLLLVLLVSDKDSYSQAQDKHRFTDLGDQPVNIGMPVEIVTRKIKDDGDEHGMLVYGVTNHSF